MLKLRYSVHQSPGTSYPLVTLPLNILLPLPRISFLLLCLENFNPFFTIQPSLHEASSVGVRLSFLKDAYSTHFILLLRLIQNWRGLSASVFFSNTKTHWDQTQCLTLLPATSARHSACTKANSKCLLNDWMDIKVLLIDAKLCKLIMQNCRWQMTCTH